MDFKFNENMLFDILKSLISFKSVYEDMGDEHPYGIENSRVLNYMLEMAKEDGFTAVNLDNHAGYIQYGAGEDYVGILCHLDVVPAGSDWTVSPFKGVETEDRIIGRGALDNKGSVAACYTALKLIKEAGIKTKYPLRLVMGLNEESGSNCMLHYLKKEKPPVVGFTPDADFPVIFAEKGIVSFTLDKAFNDTVEDHGIIVKSVKGGTATNMVADYCEAIIIEQGNITALMNSFNEDYNANIKIERTAEHTKLTVYGKAAHASIPEDGVNAISLMMCFLDVLDLQVGDSTNFIRTYARRIGTLTGGEAIGMGIEDEISGSLTFNVGMIDLTETNVSCDVNIRYPASYVLEDVFSDTFKKIMALEEIKYTIYKHALPILNEKDSPLITTLLNIYKTHTGDNDAEPIAIGGGTYARSIPNIVAFGPLFKGSADTMHQLDEYITKADLIKLVNIYTDAMIALSC